MLNAILDFFINFFWLIIGPIASTLTSAHFWRENFIYAVTYFQAGGMMIPNIGIRQMAEAFAADKAR